MAYSGTEMYRTLQQSIRLAEDRREEFKTSLAEVDQSMQSLMDLRGDLFEELAETYLPKLDPKSIQTTVEEVQTEVVALLQDKRKAAGQLNEQIDSLQSSRAEQQSELARLTEELNLLSEKRDSLEAEAKRILDQDPSYVALRKDVDQATAQLMQNEQRVAELEQERAEKLPSYEAEPLFTYLVDRKYGTKEYRSKGLIRRLDSWVAKLVRFNHHKQHYDFLRSIADLVQIEVEKRESELGKLLEQVKETEGQVFSQIGLSEVLTQGEQLGRGRERVIDELENLDRKLHELRAELLELDSPEGWHYKKAIALISDFLEQEQIFELRQRAAEMPGEVDDQLVVEIQNIEAQLKRHQLQLEDLRKAATNSEANLSELNSLHSLFIRNDFDSMRSRFDSRFNAEELFSEIAEGTTSAEAAWHHLKLYQHFEQAVRVAPYSPHLRDEMASTLGRVIVRGLGHVARGAAGGAFSGRSHRGGGTIFGGGGRGGGGFSSGEGF